MQFPSKGQVAHQRCPYPVGIRIGLVQMDDAQAFPVGTRGTVTDVNGTGSIMVDRDNGSGLNVIYGVDHCRETPTND